MKKFVFTAEIKNGPTYNPKGFYYQEKYVILVGDVKEGHTIRRKELIENVNIIINYEK